MVYRIYVEKKKELATEAGKLLKDIRRFLHIDSIEDVRVLNRYDAEGLDKELFDHAVTTVFSEPQVDIATEELSADGAEVFAVEYLPGQFDQRADSAAQCIQLISCGEKPLVRSAKIYLLYGALSAEEIAQIKNYVINPVEAREASLDLPETLEMKYDVPTRVATLDGFICLDEAGLAEFIKANGLAMDLGDITFCQKYFAEEERRDPTITEIKMIDTYWSDHCRHTTFNTIIDSAKFEDPAIEKTYQEYLATREKLGRTKPISLMDLGTLAVKALKAEGKLDKLDESEEINACTVKIEVEMDGKKEPWLLLFKNETHNHPTEIEPFGGAATCIGGAIRDPLSGRSYVYAAMRVTGAGDPTAHISDTIPGKLPQRKLVVTAAQGYSSYGNQIGLATGMVDELYHPGYIAKRMEIGAVIAAAPAENVRRERPEAGDVVILLGGSTGRDGIGGATGSSKAHDSHSVENCGAEVQKGNAPEERKLQRLFRNPEASRLIKRCNDFGAGGVSVAIGELADGLDIDLNKVPKKYEGLDGTELAISESQERMAVVTEAADVDKFLELAREENLQAVPIAVVKADPRLTMTWNGEKIVDISRAFLDTNGAEKHISVETGKQMEYKKEIGDSFAEDFKKTAEDLNICSRRGLSERFDSTIGAGTVLMPFGGKNQKTPIQSMVHLIPTEKKHTDDVSFMSWGFNPYVSEASPYRGAYLAVIESVCKLVATGAKFKDVYLSFQEYFEKLGQNPKSWGKPFEALLGAFKAQMELGIGSIGGKDSMSGSFEDIHVPPTLCSFAVTTGKVGDVVSPEFKEAGHKVILLKPEADEDGLPKASALLNLFEIVTDLMRGGVCVAAYTPGFGGVAEAVLKMSLGNGFGFKFDDEMSMDDIFGMNYGAFVLEVTEEIEGADVIGEITEAREFVYDGETVSLDELENLYEEKLEKVYSCNIETLESPVDVKEFKAESYPVPKIKVARPKVLIPAFPGTNCEYDSAKAMADAGADAEIFVVRNLSASDIRRSVDEFASKINDAQMIFIPGGFSGGDEPDGSGKFITAFFRNEEVKEATHRMLGERDGLMCGICNGFQALVKLGLVPYGKIIDADENCPTLTFNTIPRHQSKIVRTKVVSNKSPWLALTNPGDIFSVPISHGEGRFYADEELIKQLEANGQIATQYVDLAGEPTNDVAFNPNNSAYAIEGITSPDGRVFGKMGHAERKAAGLYKNVIGNYDIKMFEAAVKYFR